MKSDTEEPSNNRPTLVNVGRRKLVSFARRFTAMWRGRTVYENGRVKKFETEDIARLYLIRCDEAGKIIR